MTPRASFRDPDGHVTLEPERVVRTVRGAAAQDLAEFLGSGVARSWQRDGKLVEAREVGFAGEDRVFESPRVGFVSYPHEWPPEMLHAAATLTLDLYAALLGEGRELKDATPHNVLFGGARPIFVDLLSVKGRDTHDAMWAPYAQFARTFLIPLCLARKKPAILQEIFLAHRDGLDPGEAIGRLGLIERFRPGVLGLVTLPALLGRRRVRPPRAEPCEPEKALFIRGSLLRGLRRKTRALRPRQAASRWTEYEEATHYSPASRGAKDAFVDARLREIRPGWTLDVGCNVGRYSLMAASRGSRVVAIDSDAAVVGALWQQAVQAEADVLPLVVDVARPSPALGWANEEESSFLSRGHERFDLVLMLALLHHLVVQERVPLDRIVDLAAWLTRDHLIVEHVAREDPMFRIVARGRDHLHEGFDLDAMKGAFKRRFDLIHEMPVGPTRHMLHFRRRAPDG